MNRLTGACVLLAAMAGASVSQAAVSIVVTNLGVPNDGDSNTVQGDLVGYHAYLIQADAGSGNVISAVDFSAQGTSGKTITTPVHQSWFITSGRNGATAATTVNSTVAANNSGDESYDSHFIYADANAQLVSGTVTENNDAFNTTTGTRGVGTSPFAAYNGNSLVDGGGDAYGTGTLLSAAYAITGAQTQLTNLLYLVIPDSSHLTTALTVATPQIATGGATSGGEFDAIVIPALTTAPEPASLSLLGLSLAGMAFRRRRA